MHTPPGCAQWLIACGLIGPLMAFAVASSALHADHLALQHRSALAHHKSMAKAMLVCIVILYAKPCCVVLCFAVCNPNFFFAATIDAEKPFANDPTGTNVFADSK